jgi:hypothetical protein
LQRLGISLLGMSKLSFRLPAGIIPWVGAPQAGQGSGFFDVISAPQHPQNAAMYILREMSV